MVDPLSEKVTIRTRDGESDDSFMHQGQERTLVLVGVTKDEKIVTKFTDQLPGTGIVWHKYSDLAKDEKKLVDTLEPDLMKSGTPKSKFAHRWNLHLKDDKTGREFFKVFEGKGGKPDWEKCDVIYYTDTENIPWSNFAKLLRELGAEPGDDKPLGAYLHIGDKFTAKLILTDDGYLHLDPATLTPFFTVSESEYVPKTLAPLSPGAEKLLKFLKSDGDGAKITEVSKAPGWKEVKAYVTSFTEDGLHIKIVE